MKFNRKLAASLLIGTLLSAAPATAAPLLFNFTGSTLIGPVTASFQLDSNPTPDRINDQSAFGIGQIFFNNVSGVFNGTAATASTISFGTGLASQFQISGSPSGFAQFGGNTVFSGTLANPIFNVGTYNFTGFSRGTLTVSEVTAAVPEPATWAMMIIGFAAIGGTVRQSRRKSAVSFA